MFSLEFPKFFQSTKTWQHHLAPGLRILVIDRAEENVRQQHGLQGAVVRWLETDPHKKWSGYPARFIGFVQNLSVHLVPGVEKKRLCKKNQIYVIISFGNLWPHIPQLK